MASPLCGFGNDFEYFLLVQIPCHRPYNGMVSHLCGFAYVFQVGLVVQSSCDRSHNGTASCEFDDVLNESLMKSSA
jgi:hypothetical protein